MIKAEKADLEEMFVELDKANTLYRPSLFWIELNKVHVNHLSESGINHFKRSISVKYFSWGVLGIIRHQLFPIFKALMRGGFSTIFCSPFENYNSNLGEGVRKFNLITAKIYSIYVASFFDYVSADDPYKILEKLEEPLVGDPFVINCGNRSISQDLCNSAHEFYSIVKNIPDFQCLNIAELGSGYGRLGYVFLKTLPESNYCFIDIPPALFIAQSYMTEVFPNEKIFKFRTFSSFEEVRREFEESKIRFLMPHQLELLPKKYFDLFINISSLHEMARSQIENYMIQIDKVTEGYFYTKQWRQSRTKDNNFIKENEYPVPKNWERVYRRGRHPIQNMFFDAIYKI